MAPVEFPEALFERVHSGNCVLCTGVRLASAAGMPDWPTLIDKMKARAGADGEDLDALVEAGKLLTVAGYLKRKLGPDACAEVLAEAYAAGDGDLPETHAILGELPFHAALSTAYDGLVERALGTNGEAPRVYTYADGAVLRLAEELQHYVLKAHGDVGHREELGNRLVLSRLDYKRLIGPNQAFRAFVEDLYRTHTLLLVGYHPGDPDFALLLDQLVGFQDALTDHYALLSGVSPAEEEELYANYRIRTVPYDEGDDPVAALTEVLRSLRDQWREKGEELPGPEDPRQQVEWLRTQLAKVATRIDHLPVRGLDYTEAQLAAIQKAAADMDLSALDADTLCRLGNVNMLLGEITRSIDVYNAALEQDDECAEAHLNLHVAMSEAGQFDESLEHIKKAGELERTLRVFPSQYELQQVLGRGSVGSIYKAHDTKNDRDVTLKVLRTSFLQEYASPEQWVKEAKRLAELEHDNLARVYDASLEHGKCIMVTEWLAGRSLGDVIASDGPMTPERASAVMSDICAGLQHAHDQGVLHLDLTPTNVFLGEDGEGVQVMDFRPIRQGKGHRPAIGKGSEGFVAPEVYAGAGADARADVYSLGALLYYMLSGNLPVGSFPRLGEANQLARRYDPLVGRAMRAVPDERYATVKEFGEAVAGRTEEVQLPDSEDDLAGWLEVLSYQPDHEQARRVVERLEARYREEKDWDDLITLIVGMGEVETDTGRRIEMFTELAGIFEKEMGDPGGAFAALKEAFRENTTSLELRKDLERLAGATGMWNELLQEYSQIVQTVRDPKVACDWWVLIGQLYARELGHDDYAIASFNQALALDTNRRDALAEMVELSLRKGDHQNAVQLLTRQIDLEEDVPKKAELFKQLARLYVGELKDEDKAIETFRQVLELDATNEQAVGALEGLYRKGERWEELARLMRDQIGLTDDAEALKRHRATLADVLADRLDRADEAIDQYQDLLEADPDDANALTSLERLYDKTGRADEYLEILDKRIEAAGSDEEKATLCRRMATEWEERPGGQERAAEYLEKVVEYTGGDDETFRALVRNYWALKDYEKLAAAYDRHINITPDPGDRAILFAALGKVYEDHLDQPDKAIEVFNNLLAVDEQSKIGLSALGRLYERTGAWAQAVQMLQKEVEKEEDVDRQVELFHRMGSLQYENMAKIDDAEVSFSKALELRDDHVEAMNSLAALYRERHDFGKAARMLRDAAEHTANELDKVKRLHQAGVTYLDDLDDEERALEVFEQLIEIDPEHVETGARLAEIYEKRGQWEQALPLLEMLVRKADSKERGALIELNLRLGRVAVAAEATDKAIAAYRAAYDLDPTSQEALHRLADLLYQKEEHAEAGKLFQALLVHRRDTLESEQIVDVFYKLGDIKQAMGEQSKALNMYEKALDLAPSDPRVLERAIALYKEKDDYEAVLRCKKNILKGATDDEVKQDVAEEIGDLLTQKLKRPAEAVSYFNKVIELKADHRRVLNKIMEAYILQKKWDDAIKAMGKIEDHETDPTHRARLHYTAAVIYRDELNRPKDAAHHFDQALVKDPTNRRAFEALKKLYTDQGNFKGLAKAYRLMLQRLPEETPKAEQEALWHELGDICQHKLHDAKGAIVAYEVAAKLNPANEARQELLAQLYATAGPDAYEKAIVANQRRLRSNPLREEAYRELRRLYGEVGDYDKAWCVAAVLGWLGKGSAEEQALYAKHRTEEPRKVARKLSEDLWRDHLYHERQRGVLNDVFSIVQPLVAPMAVRSAKALGLRASEQVDIEQDPRPFRAALDYVCQVLDQTVGSMYLKATLEHEQQLQPVLTGSADEVTSSILVTPRIVTDESRTELNYWLTKAVALLRPSHLLFVAVPSATVLRAVAVAVRKLVRPETRLEGDTAELEKLVRVFRSDLPPGKLDLVAERADELRDSSSEEAIAAWMEAVDLSATRAALLLSDDLETAAKLLSTEPTPYADDHAARVKERLQELMVFAVSEDYFKLREVLGLAVK